MKSSLGRKMQWARKLLKGSKESYDKLTASALPANLHAWWEGELTVQQNQAKNVKNMDYYALKCKKGGVFIFSFLEPQSQTFAGSAPGKAEIQLELSWEQPCGKVSAI